jgi:hypothetical protein
VDTGASRLGKRAVEEMVRSASTPAEDLAAEVDQVREALVGPLAHVVGRPPEAGWVALVDRAGELGHWDRERWAQLRLAVEPERCPDLEAAVAALWDLVTELNERRRL